MYTRRYTIAIARLIPEIVTQSIPVRVWERVARKVRANTGIYVNAWLNESCFPCEDRRGPEPGGLTANLIITWSPIEMESYEEFHEVFTQIVNGVREILGNPHVQIIIDDIEFYCFVKY